MQHVANRGKYIVIEGLEGAGKTSVLTAVHAILKNAGHQICITREPGGTSLGEQIRTLVKQHNANGEVVQHGTELMLMYAARLQLITQVIEPALNNGRWVISDRSEWSTFAYQGGGRNIPKATILELSNLIKHELIRTGYSDHYFKPDLVIYLDIDPTTGFGRVKKRGEPIDRIETESMAFFHRVRVVYNELVKQAPYPVIQIDASQHQTIIIDKITQQLQHIFGLEL